MWSRKERPRGHRVRAGRYFCWTVKTKKNVTSEARAGQLRWGEASSLTPATPTSDLGLISQDQSQSSKHFSPPCIEPHVPVKCPPPLSSPSAHIQEVRVTRRGKGAAGDRSPPVSTVHTGACVTLLDYYYLSFPLSFDLSLSATLQNINFAFWNFSAGGLYTPTRYLNLYLICRWCNTIGVWIFSLLISFKRS